MDVTYDLIGNLSLIPELDLWRWKQVSLFGHGYLVPCTWAYDIVSCTLV